MHRRPAPSARTFLRSTFLLATPLLFFMISCEGPDDGRPEAFGESIPYRSFWQSDVFFRNSNTLFAILKNKDDEQSFLNSIITSDGIFPDFSYGDSMLIGILLGENPDVGLSAASTDNFSIDSLIAYADTIKVYSHLFLPKIRTDDVITPSHFVVIEKTDKEFHMMEVVYIYENPY